MAALKSIFFCMYWRICRKEEHFYQKNSDLLENTELFIEIYLHISISTHCLLFSNYDEISQIHQSRLQTQLADECYVK